MMQSQRSRKPPSRKYKQIGITFQMLLAKTTNSEITTSRHQVSKTSGKPHQHQTSNLASGWKVFCKSRNLQRRNVIWTKVQEFSLSYPSPCHKFWVRTKTLHILSRKVVKSFNLFPQWWVPNRHPLIQLSKSLKTCSREWNKVFKKICECSLDFLWTIKSCKKERTKRVGQFCSIYYIINMAFDRLCTNGFLASLLLNAFKNLNILFLAIYSLALIFMCLLCLISHLFVAICSKSPLNLYKQGINLLLLCWC